MRRLAIVILLAACVSRPAAESDLERVHRGLQRDPHNTVLLYVMATAHDRRNDVAGVVSTLTKLDELGWNLGLAADSFPNSSASPEFQALAAKLAARETESLRATLAFRLPPTVRSEGIAHDPVDDVFYLSGGAAKLLRVHRDGTTSELPIDPFEGAGRLGMDVDAERRQIWAVSARLQEKGSAAISVYDLQDGRLVRRVTLGSPKQPGFLNDLTLLRDGTAFVTDTARHHVYRLRPGAEAFELWADGFWAPNGITVSADERTLYVADFNGITRFDLATKKRRLLTTSTPLNGIDGLVEHKGTLIGIQNVLGRPRVVRVHPAENDRVEVLESKNPQLSTPATGVVAGNEFYFVANLRERESDRLILKIAL